MKFKINCNRSTLILRPNVLKKKKKTKISFIRNPTFYSFLSFYHKLNSEYLE